MRSIETLAREYPDKTANELFEIQEQDKLEDQKEFEKHNAKKLAFIKDINENGGYFKGRFGLDQHYYYHVYNMKMESNGEVYMDVEKIVLFYNPTDDTRQVTRPNEIRIERRTSTYENLDRYGLSFEKRTNENDWDAINNYLNAMSEMFWSEIKPI